MCNQNNKHRYEVNLESERLLLRNIQESDKEFIVNLWTDKDVTKYMGGPREKDKMIMGVGENLSDPFVREFDLWPVIEKKSNQPIGHCGLLLKEIEGDKEVELIYVIDKHYWGKGYAYEIGKILIDYGFMNKKLQKIVALIKPENEGSKKVAIKVGMHFEKEIIRQDDIKMHMYSISKDK